MIKKAMCLFFIFPSFLPGHCELRASARRFVGWFFADAQGNPGMDARKGTAKLAHAAVLIEAWALRPLNPGNGFF